MFLALAYFGCDQSQVQRYLTGKSMAQSRLSLLFNAMAKIPMQFFILFIGAMVFVFFNYERPPLLFQPVELKNIQHDARFPAVERRYQEAYAHRKRGGGSIIYRPTESGDPAARTASIQRYRDAQQELNDAHTAGEQLVGKEFDDTNYIFLSFVTRYLPAGVVGLIVAVIFSAAMSSTSGEINSLAAVTVIDIYRRHIKRDASDRHYLIASRIATVFWGCFAMGFAQYGRNFGALIQAVNVIGSLFYGGLLGVFVLAFFFRSVGANGAFFGVLAGEAAIFAANLFTNISFLWYNVIGCVVVVLVALAVSKIFDCGQTGGDHTHLVRAPLLRALVATGLQQLRHREEERNLHRRGLRRVRPMHRVALDVLRELLAHGAFRRLLRIGRAHHLAPVFDRVLALQHQHHHRTFRHERHQAAEKRPLAVDVVKAFRLLFGKPRHFHAANAESGLFDHRENLARVSRRYRVRLDDCKCLFDCHVLLNRRAAAIGGS